MVLIIRCPLSSLLSGLLLLPLSVLFGQGTSSRGWLGFAVDSIAGGARVRAIESGSPAASAGLVIGDKIAAIDGQPVTYSGFVEAMLRTKVGAEIHFVVERAGARREIRASAVLPPSVHGGKQAATRDSIAMMAGSYLVSACRGLDSLDRVDTIPVASSRGGSRSLALPRWCVPEASGTVILHSGDSRYRYAPSVAGLYPLALNATLASYFNSDASGVLIVDVALGSPADLAGFLPGDVVVRIRGQRPRGVVDVMRGAVTGPAPCDVLRHGRIMHLTLPPISTSRPSITSSASP